MLSSNDNNTNNITRLDTKSRSKNKRAAAVVKNKQKANKK